MLLETELLKSDHNKAAFDCGIEVLDRYIKEQAKQDVKRKLAVCFVLIEAEDGQKKVKGYYTLSSEGIPRELIPKHFQNKFPPSYKSIPTTLLGRLARDKQIKSKRVGEFLLLDALFKAYESAKVVASFAVVVDPIDENAKNFYKKYGFELLPDSGRMFIPMATINQLFQG